MWFSVAALNFVVCRRRRRRMYITAGEESEANVTSGIAETIKRVVEEGERDIISFRCVCSPSSTSINDDGWRR